MPFLLERAQFATTVLIASMLAFVGDASARDDAGAGLDIGDACICYGACYVVTTCLVNYCIQETVCDECGNCRSVRRGAAYMARQQSMKPREKLCVYRKGAACVTAV